MSDIHSNLESLIIGLKIMHKHNVDSILCLGDIVGYGPNPSECIDIVRRETSGAVIGNHDLAVVSQENAYRFNKYALLASIWTADNISQDQLDFLARLPYTLSIGDKMMLTHGSPFQPDQFNYIIGFADAQYEFNQFSQHICFIGHSHKPAVFCDNGNFYIPSGGRFQLEEGQKYIINVGSVGQPRDRQPLGCVVIYDDIEDTIRFFRYTYPFTTTQNKIKNLGLPAFLADRLSQGM